MNWYERQPAGNVNAYWLSCAIDADGSNLIAGCTRLYTSSNGGVSWTERRPAGDIDKNWFGVASDDDGSNLIVGAMWGRLYTSSDGGANWTERRPAGDIDADYAWRVASDANGSHLIAANENKRIYISSDGGENWTETTPTGTAEDWGWSCCASNDDGSVLIVGALSTGADTGSLFVSTNGGASWVNQGTRPVVQGNNSFDWTVPSTPSVNCKVRLVENVSPYYKISSNTFSIIDSAPPSPPQNLTLGRHPVIPGLVLSWQASTGYPSFYRVYFCAESNGRFSLLGTVEAPQTSYIDSSASSRARGFYRVEAVRE